MKTTKNKKSGFTLVELMIVAAIIAILAAIVIPLMTKNKESAVAAEGQNLAGAALSAAKAEYARTGTFPTSDSALDDAVLVAEIASSGWSVTMTAPTATAAATATATITGSKNGFSGSVSLGSDGTWTIALTPATGG